MNLFLKSDSKSDKNFIKTQQSQSIFQSSKVELNKILSLCAIFWIDWTSPIFQILISDSNQFQYWNFYYSWDLSKQHLGVEYNRLSFLNDNHVILPHIRGWNMITKKKLIEIEKLDETHDELTNISRKNDGYLLIS